MRPPTAGIVIWAVACGALMAVDMPAAAGALLVAGMLVLRQPP